MHALQEDVLRNLKRRFLYITVRMQVPYAIPGLFLLLGFFGSGRIRLGGLSVYFVFGGQTKQMKVSVVRTCLKLINIQRILLEKYILIKLFG